jgi:putative endonuclease
MDAGYREDARCIGGICGARLRPSRHLDLSISAKIHPLRASTTARRRRRLSIVPKPARNTIPAASAQLRLQRGQASEELAAQYLQAQGLIVIARNFRCRGGELDLICLDASVSGGVMVKSPAISPAISAASLPANSPAKTLVIVEVRQRGRRDFGGALGSVTAQKRRKIVRATAFFLQRHSEWRNHVMRFDVVALQGLPNAAHEIVWIKDAFRTG